MCMNKADNLEIEEYKLDLENRIRNLLWTVSGDYTLKIKPDVSLFLRSRAIALYDGIKQGAFAKYYDKELMGLYLVKKIFLQADERDLTALAQLCIEEAIGEKICRDRPGVKEMQSQAFSDILDQEFEEMPSEGDMLGRLKIAVLRDRLSEGEHKVEKSVKIYRDLLYQARQAEDTMELLKIIDSLYNRMIDPSFEQQHGDLSKVLSVTMEELMEYGWEDYLSEDMYEDALAQYVEQLTANMTSLEDSGLTEDMDKKRKTRHKITVLSPEALEKSYTYVELNYGRTYLTPGEEKKMNYLMCREIHSDCSLY